jgi:protein-disulfide isomerase
MLAKTLSVTTALTVLVGLGACNMSAQSNSVPETAQSREDVEAIVRAYLLENPEIIMEAMLVLEERENSRLGEQLASNDADFSVGPVDADVTIVEYFDYHCGYCRRSLDWVMDQVENSDGRVRVVFKELPILSEQSVRAARAAIASQNQGEYLEFHQAMMRHSGQLSDDDIFEIARDVGMNATRLERDMESAEVDAHLARVLGEAREHGVTGTPAFFINGELYSGFAQRELEQRIESLLEG